MLDAIEDSIQIADVINRVRLIHRDFEKAAKGKDTGGQKNFISSYIWKIFRWKCYNFIFKL